ncbi:MAG: hypothetical protein COB04_14560 [Gammaproteobacteria bacterium]|nr:MAG: hypothetical protein COB04_14560 [Gammaproteobacteria bacterium]
MKSCQVLKSASKWSYEIEPNTFLRGLDMRQPDRATLHFLHGIAFSGAVYWPLLKPLTEQYGLFTQDYQGHGESDLCKEFGGWQGAIDHVQSVMQDQNVNNQDSPLIGFGHSYGASLSLIMAAKDENLFSSLILLDPMIFPQTMLDMLDTMPEGQNPMTERIVNRISQWPSRKDAKEYFASKKAFREWRDDGLESFLDYTLKEEPASGEMSLVCPPSLEAQFVGSPLMTIWQAIDTVKIPTVMIHSEDDASPLRQSCIEASKRNPNIQAVEMKGGHNFMQEHPQDTLEVVREYLQRFTQ